MNDPIIPRHILFADPMRTMVKLSPRGEYLSYLAPHQHNLNLWIMPSDKMQPAKVITQSKQPIRDYWWAPTHQHLLYIHDQNGDENWQLCGVDIKSGETQIYTSPDQQVRLLQISAKEPIAIIALNKRDQHYFDVYQLNILSGELTCIYENHEFWDFIVDDNLQIRIAVKVHADGGDFYDMADPKNPKILAPLSQLDLLDLYFYPRLKMGLASDGETLYLAQSIKTNTAALMSLHLKTKVLKTIGCQTEADVCDVLFDPINKEPQAYATYYERKKWHPITEKANNDLNFLTMLDSGDIEILSQTADNQQWIVAFYHDDNATHYYWYHRQKNSAEFLFDSNDDFKNQAFTSMHACKIPTRDGLTCVSYLSLPKESDPSGNGVPSSPLPLVLMVHGGPTYRDFWGYNPVHQWLVNRGYAVLSVNYRASTGFGKAHMQAGNGEWGGKIQQDLIDAVDWAIKKGITEEGCVAIMGRSFGGYATLMGLTTTPDKFCCGVDIVGPADLVTLLAQFPPYWQAMRNALNDMVGCDHQTAQGKAFLAKRSPIHYADRIKKPLLIGHGVNDVRVLQSESDHMANALKANNIPITYVVFPDEGHQFLHPGNREAFYALVEKFLAKNLGGRFEAYDRSVETSMIVVEDDFDLCKA